MVNSPRLPTRLYTEREEHVDNLAHERESKTVGGADLSVGRQDMPRPFATRADLRGEPR